MRIELSRRLWVTAALWAGILLTAFDAWAAAGFLGKAAVQDDFRLVYLAARLVLTRGWPRLYDFAAQRAEAAALGFSWQPYITPPPLVVLGLPFTALPFGAALALWTGLLAAAAAAAWWLAAPGEPLERWAHLALALGFFPLAFAIAIGQPSPLVLLAVAAGWALLRRGRDGWAGACLALLVLKPQLALLVPVALLVAGRMRAGLTALALAGATALGSAALLGPAGVHDYLAGLADASSWALTRRYTAADVLPLPLTAAASVAALVLTVVAAWRARQGGAEVPLAAGLVGSTLVTPYIGLQDFSMLLLAGWLILRSRPAPWMIGLLGLGYLLLEVALLEPSLPVVAWRAGLLVALAAQPYREGREPQAEGGRDQRLVREGVREGAR